MRCITELVQLTREDFPSTPCMTFFIFASCALLFCSFAYTVLAQGPLQEASCSPVYSSWYLAKRSSCLRTPSFSRVFCYGGWCLCNTVFVFSNRWYWAIIANQDGFKLSSLLIKGPGFMSHFF